MENKNGDICANCGAVYELHSYTADLCPKNGKESEWNEIQEWEEFSFLPVKSEYDKLKEDNALLIEALENMMEQYKLNCFYFLRQESDTDDEVIAKFVNVSSNSASEYYKAKELLNNLKK